MTLALPFVACTKQTVFPQNIKNNKQKLNDESKPKTQTPPKTIGFTRKDYQDANSIIGLNGLFRSQDEFTKKIAKFSDNPEKHAFVIARVISEAAKGFGTNENAMKAAVYSITSETLPLVEKELKKIEDGDCPKLGVRTYIDEEMSDLDGRLDLIRHIEQFKN